MLLQSCPCRTVLCDCDPDLCVKYGASEMHLTCDHTQHNTTTETPTAAAVAAAETVTQTCYNMPLTIQHPAPLKLGVSEIPNAGYGAYTQHDLKKGQFITEYKGEQVRSILVFYQLMTTLHLYVQHPLSLCLQSERYAVH